MRRAKTKIHARRNKEIVEVQYVHVVTGITGGFEGGAGPISLHSHVALSHETRGEKGRNGSKPTQEECQKSNHLGGSRLESCDRRGWVGYEGVSQRQGAALWSAQVHCLANGGRVHGCEWFSLEGLGNALKPEWECGMPIFFVRPVQGGVVRFEMCRRPWPRRLDCAWPSDGDYPYHHDALCAACRRHGSREMLGLSVCTNNTPRRVVTRDIPIIITVGSHFWRLCGCNYCLHAWSTTNMHVENRGKGESLTDSPCFAMAILLIPICCFPRDGLQLQATPRIEVWSLTSRGAQT